MRTRFIEFWNTLRYSFWFLPMIMTIASIVTSLVTIQVDYLVGPEVIKNIPWVYPTGPEGARTLLSTVAGSMIGVTGIVFSITIVVLTLTSSQFGPRILRNFMRDKATQVVLGTFISTFIYCLLIARSVRVVGEVATFVPYISLTFGIVLSIVSLFVLIYFIHHISVSIQASTIIASIGRDMEIGITSLFPEKMGEEEPEEEETHWWRYMGDVPSDFDERSNPIKAVSSGYLLANDNEGLMSLAKERDIIIELKCRPGNFVTEGTNIAVVWPGECVDEDLVKRINDKFILGTERTHTQDVEFSVNQLVEIALRALSPGINDPFTAITCIDRLGVGLCKLAERSIASPYRLDEENRLRVIAKPTTFKDVIDTAFNQIRQYGISSVAVSIRLLDTLAVLAEVVRREEDRAALLRHANMVREESLEMIPGKGDRSDVEERYRTVVKVLAKKTTY